MGNHNSKIAGLVTAWGERGQNLLRPLPGRARIGIG